MVTLAIYQVTQPFYLEPFVCGDLTTNTVKPVAATTRIRRPPVPEDHCSQEPRDAISSHMTLDKEITLLQRPHFEGPLSSRLRQVSRRVPRMGSWVPGTPPPPFSLKMQDFASFFEKFPRGGPWNPPPPPH